jgi:uncharacterized protein with FMN-binding domain
MVSMTTLYDFQNELAATSDPSETSDVTPPQSSTPILTADPRLDLRLQRLAARNAATRSQRQGNKPSVQLRGQHATEATSRRTRRQHAAKGSRAAALAMSAVGTLGLAAYFQHSDAAASASSSKTTSATTTQSASAALTAGQTTTTALSNATTLAAATSASTASASTTAAAAAAATVSSSGLADGTFTGATFTNKWGPVQAAITVSGGKVVSVNVLQTPTADNKSITINNRAVPTLVTEALTAQSSQVDTVSGATYTSDSYRSSLQSALDAARAAAINPIQS